MYVGEVNSIPDAVDMGEFEQVPLEDNGPEGTLGNSVQSASPECFSHSSGEAQETFQSPNESNLSDFISSSAAELQQLDSINERNVDPAAQLHSLSTNLGSVLYCGRSRAPSVSSEKAQIEPITSNTSPELLHLVDSAIMGRPQSLEKLKNLVSGVESFNGNGRTVIVAFSVVDSLLATMGGVESFEEDDDSSPPTVMLNTRAAVVAAELIPWLPSLEAHDSIMSPRTRLVRGLLAILRACTRNRSMCSTAGLLCLLLDSVQKIFVKEVDQEESIKWNGSPLCNCIQYLAGHSLSVIDLHKLLQLISRVHTTKWAHRLILSLERAINCRESRGPACTFEYDGENSGLLGPGESHWPFTNGFAFATWIYVESFADTLNTATAAAAIAAAAAGKSGKSSAMSAAAAASALAGEGTSHMPRLFSFLSVDSLGVEAYFHAQFLVVEICSGRGKRASLHFTYPFKPQYWYFIGLEHVSKLGLLGKTDSELRLYIDGLLYESRPFEFPRISMPLAFCCIGTNPPPTIAGLQRRRRQCPLFAEMGAIYIFKEPIGPEKMSRLASRGGDALPSFGSGAGFPWLSTNEHLQSLADNSLIFDAEISGSIHLLYHPKLLRGRFCPDISPLCAAGALRRPAEALGQVHVAMRMRPVEALWSLAFGGPISLLPLTVDSVHKDSLEPLMGENLMSLATVSLAAPIFRIISLSITHPMNSEELFRTKGPEILATILKHLLKTISCLEFPNCSSSVDEELVAAVVSLCQSPRNNHLLRVQLFSTLLLDLKIWSLCNYGLQKKLLSSLADMVFTESAIMRHAEAIQRLLDGCRRCYWMIREKESVETFFMNGDVRPTGEVNALVDELLVVVELLIGASTPFAEGDMRCLLHFVADCPQSNQVTRVLLLIHRLLVQPNTSRAHSFADAFLSCGGIETVLILLQREAKAGDDTACESFIEEDVTSHNKFRVDGNSEIQNRTLNKCPQNLEEGGTASTNEKSTPDFLRAANGIVPSFTRPNIKKVISVPEASFMKILGGISYSISADNARNNVYNVDNADGIVYGIISLLYSLVSCGYLEHASHSFAYMEGNSLGNGFHQNSLSMFHDKVSLLFFALEKALQSSPNRLLTENVYASLLRASVNASSAEDGLNLYDPSHRFEHLQILLVLLHVLPYAPKKLQIRALQDLLLLACSHPENRSSLTGMEEWPEWILEVLISNYEMDLSKHSETTILGDVHDLIHGFLMIILEHSMRQKDGWKDIEATVHCAEWICMVGGSSTGNKRMRREEALPIFKRRLLCGLMDFSSKELQVQTQVIAAAAAGVAAEGLPPQEAKAEAENVSLRSVVLVENSIVILMLVEDHLRLQSKLYNAAHRVETSAFSRSTTLSSGSGSHFHSASGGESLQSTAYGFSSSVSGGVPLEVLASLADANGHVSAEIMERFTSAAAAEPYESVYSAFVSYGSCAVDLAAGWKYRSRLWYGVGFPITEVFGGGGSGWESWEFALQKDSDGNWIEIPLVRKSVSMLEALLLDESGFGGGFGIGEGLKTGMGGMTSLYQLLDSDQPFLCMLRVVLVSLREENMGNVDVLTGKGTVEDESSAGSVRKLDSKIHVSDRPLRSALLWSILAPVLNMEISESKRQRVWVASCILYSEVWHSFSTEKEPLRKKYLEAILPPFVSILRRWRPLLASIHELAIASGVNPFVAEGRALAADALPMESALAMISLEWAVAFASPPAAMALAMIAAGSAGAEMSSVSTTLTRPDSSLVYRRPSRLHTFSGFHKSPVTLPKSRGPKDSAAAKAAALAAARELERTARIGSSRGLSAVAMATSTQRRNAGDMNRAKRWNITEAKELAWSECLQSIDTKSGYSMDFNSVSYKFVAITVASLALARNMQRFEVDRQSMVYKMEQCSLFSGTCAWRKLIHCLGETGSLFGPLCDFLNSYSHIFWRLDFIESSSRMRPCFRRNYKGSYHLCAASNHGDVIEQSEENVPSPVFSLIAAEAISMKQVNVEDEHTDLDSTDSTSLDMERSDEVPTVLSASEQLVHSEGSQNLRFQGDHQSKLSSSNDSSTYISGDMDEHGVLEIAASMVRLLCVIPGTFQITTKKINFIVHHDERHTGDKLPCCSYPQRHGKNRYWPLVSLRHIYGRRYLLRRSALELFLVDKSNYFFDFGTTEGRSSVYRALIQVKSPMLNNISFVSQPEKLLKRTKLMERWARREISNFEYLMQLNTLAGRSYNDITQYPVFPWILSDYTSKVLDLEDPSVFRDLSKPVGALSAVRLSKFQERFSNFDDPVIPKFHYGSHYSTAGTVLYYLLRVEPFTTLSVHLQGGKFDHADRMFSDIGATWDGVVRDMCDVKELVPELFYLPEILTNENLIEFGTTQLREKIDCVGLPAWADSPIDFIQKHRMALEGEHVSNHLHEWIDLIFGYKQRGKEAELANNVFFYVTYEGTVDIDKISDPAVQRSTQDQIAYFGQTPSQLFTVPHAKRLPLSDVLHLQNIFRNPKQVKSFVVPSSELCNIPASAIHASPDFITTVDLNAPASRVARCKWQPNTRGPSGLPFLFPNDESVQSSGGGAFMRLLRGARSSSVDRRFPRAVAFAASGVRSPAIVSITPDGEIVTGGHADNSVKLVSPDRAETLETATAHCAPVTCVAVSPDGASLVTGSRDATLILWKLHRAGTSSGYRRRRIEGPVHVLRGHRREIACCCVDSDVGVVVSSSESSEVLLHSTGRGRLLRRLAGVVADGVCLSPSGTVMTWNNDLAVLRTFTLNAVPVCSARFPTGGCIGFVRVSADGVYACVGLNARASGDSTQGGSDFNVGLPAIMFFRVNTLEVVHGLRVGEGSHITAMALSKDNRNLLVSTSDKRLVILTDPALSHS